MRTIVKGVVLVFLGMICGCCPDMDAIQVSFEAFHLPTDTKVEKIAMLSAQEGYAVGGRQFGQGFIAHTKDAWKTVQYDSLSRSVILDIACQQDGVCLAVGFASYLYLGGNEKGWITRQLPQDKRLSGVEVLDQDHWLVVGGSGLGDGILHIIDRGLNEVMTIDTFLHELADVARTEAAVHVVGYGLVMHTDDGAKNWKGSDVQGDFFSAIDFVNVNRGYVVGEFGSILRSDDGGQNWKKLRNGNLLWEEDLGFRDVLFWEDEEGVICGDGQICWITNDGGHHWSTIRDIPKLDYQCIDRYEDQLWLGASNGQIVSFFIPR